MAAKKGMHRMPDGHMMSDAQMRKMMGSASKPKRRKAAGVKKRKKR